MFCFFVHILICIRCWYANQDVMKLVCWYHEPSTDACVYTIDVGDSHILIQWCWNIAKFRCATIIIDADQKVDTYYLVLYNMIKIGWIDRYNIIVMYGLLALNYKQQQDKSALYLNITYLIYALIFFCVLLVKPQL